MQDDPNKASAAFRLAAAVAAYGQLLRGDEYTGRFDYRDVIALAGSANGVDSESGNFLQLAKLAEGLSTQAAHASLSGDRAPDCTGPKIAGQGDSPPGRATIASATMKGCVPFTRESAASLRSPTAGPASSFSAACRERLRSRPAEYYAYRHNQFWRITGAILGFEPAAPYARRKAALKKAGIAIWDVLESCVRPGSLDSAIQRDSMRANDFAAFLAAYPGIRRVCFNGRKAESAWRRHVAPTLARNDAP